MAFDKFFKLPFYQPNKAQANEQPRTLATGDGPLDMDRSLTDKKYLKLFGVSVLTWVIVTIYAYVVGDKIAVDYSNVLYHIEIQQVSSFLIFYLSKVSYVLAWDLPLSVFVLAIFVAMCRWATRVMIYIMIFSVFVVLALIYILFYFSVYIAGDNWFPELIITSVTTIYVLCLYVLWKTGIDMICKVIEESIKAIFANPSTMLIAILQFVLTIAVFGYFVSVFGFLYSIRNESFEAYVKNHVYFNDTEDINEWIEFKTMMGGSLPDNYRSVPVHIYLFHAINFICFLWMGSFISGVCRMILTSTFATWYNNKSDRKSSVSTVPKSVRTILRYHLGTVAYASSICSWVPMMKVIYENGREVLQKLRKKPIYVLSCITIVSNFSLNALATCAIHGQDFYESAKESYKLQIKNMASYLVIHTVSQVIIFLASLITVAISAISGAVYISQNLKLFTNGRHSYEAAVASCFCTILVPLFLSLTFFMTFHAASETIRLCHFEDSKFSQEDEMKLYEVQVDDFKEDDD